MKKISCIILILIFTFAAAFPASADNAASTVKEIVTRTNLERENKGLAPLKTSNALNSAAQVRAKELAQSYSHTRPNGEKCFTVFEEFNIKSRSSAENIASSTGYGSAEFAVDSWMNSTVHRKNILSTKYTHIGVGFYQSGSTRYYLQIFANIDSSSNDHLAGQNTSKTTVKTTNKTKAKTTTKTTAKTTVKTTVKTTAKSTVKTTTKPTTTTAKPTTTTTTTKPTTTVTTTTTTTKITTATTATQPTSSRGDSNSDSKTSIVDDRSIVSWILMGVLLIGAVISVVFIYRYRKSKLNR